MNTKVKLPQEILDLERMVQLIPNPTYLKDINGVYVGCNPLFLSLLKLQNQADLVGKTDLDMFWKEQAKKIRGSDDKVLKIGLLVEAEEYFNLSDGEKIPVLTRKSPLRDNQNQIIGLIATLTDLSEQKNLEAILEKNKKETEIAQIKVEQRIQAMIDTIAGNHWWKDKEGRYLGCNQIAANTWQLNSPEEVIGKTDYELPWSTTADTLIAHDQSVMESGKALTKEELVTTKNGLPLTFLVTKAPLRDHDGKIIGTIGTSVPRSATVASRRR